MPFILAIAEQAAHRMGWNEALDEAVREAHAFGVASTLVDRAGQAQAARDSQLLDATAYELASDPVMLAAFYQNIDLLYASGYADADAVSALVMRALEHSAEMPRP